MRNALLVIFGILIGVGGYWGYTNFQNTGKQDIENKIIVDKPKPLLKYTIENLGKREYKSQIVLDEQIKETKELTIHKFHFDSDGKNVTGVITMPIKNSLAPTIIQFRGYAPTEDYYPGYGTGHSAEKYAKAGFITIAPDFLGYGESASPSANVWEARFETYTTAANLLAAAKNLPMVDSNKIGIWGHSNGGQIALTTLEITGKNYPTVLWAPQSLPFPYSVVYYMEENGEGDRSLRLSLSRFEEDYNSNLFNPLNYVERINAPLLLHQGTLDEQVPVKFTEQLFNKLKNINKDVTYYKYPGADHNFLPIENWNRVVERDITFFQNKFEITGIQ